MSSVDEYSQNTGRTPTEASTTFAAPAAQPSPLSTSFAGDSLAKMSPVPGPGPGWRARVRGFGSSTSESSENCGPDSALSRTSRQVQKDGCARCEGTCTLSDTQRLPSRFLPPTSAPHTSDDESSLLPTLTRKANLLSPTMQKWPAGDLLPTLTAQAYGSNQGGAAGRVGEPRLSLQSMASKGLLPTLIRRDENGPGLSHTKGGRDLPTEVGGHLSADWSRWFMGFPVGWLDGIDASESEP